MKTVLAYQQFHCRACHKQFNERSGTKFNFIEFPTEVVMLVVYHYYRFKLSLDDVVELMAIRGIHLSHQTVHNWTQTFGVELGLRVREARKSKVGIKWNVDATYVKVNGKWCYLYRAIDKNGDLVDARLSDVRNTAAAESFFQQCAETTGVIPNRITTDKEPTLYPAIENTFPNTMHRDSKYMNNVIEQNHRGIKSRIRSMKGFCGFLSTLIFCTVFEEIQQLFRTKNASRSERRSIVPSKFQKFEEMFTNL